MSIDFHIWFAQCLDWVHKRICTSVLISKVLLKTTLIMEEVVNEQEAIKKVEEFREEFWKYVTILSGLGGNEKFHWTSEDDELYAWSWCQALASCHQRRKWNSSSSVVKVQTFSRTRSCWRSNEVGCQKTHCTIAKYGCQKPVRRWNHQRFLNHPPIFTWPYYHLKRESRNFHHCTAALHSVLELLLTSGHFNSSIMHWGGTKAGKILNRLHYNACGKVYEMVFVAGHITAHLST